MGMNFIKRFILSILALVVFATSSCFAIDIHICKGEVQSTAIFSKATPCDQMDEMQKEEVRECCKKIRDARIAESSSKQLIKKKQCCFNHSIEFKLDQNQDAQSSFIVLDSFSEIVLFKEELASSINAFNLIRDELLRGPPDPNTRRSSQSFFQVYII